MGDHIAEVTLPTSRVRLAVRIQKRVVRGLIALDIKAHEPPPRAAVLLRDECAPSGEMALLEVNEPTEPQLERRSGPSGMHGALGGDEIDIRHDEARLDTRNVQSLRTDWPNAARAPRCHETVPYSLSVVKRHP